MPAKKLVDIARQSAIRSSRDIYDIGDCSYELIRPVLLKIENPAQLRTIEENSPQVLGHDEEVWINLIKRDIPNGKERVESIKRGSIEPDKWWKVYRRLKKEAEKDMGAGADRLKAALSTIQSAKEQNTSVIVSKFELPKPGSRSRRQQITHDYTSGRTGSKGAHAMSLMDKVRKEAREAKAARMSRPFHELKKRSTGVREAPQAFVQEIKQQNEARAAALAPRPPAKIRVPRPPMHGKASGYDMTKDREERLRALKSGKSSATRKTDSEDSAPGGLSLDFLEEDDDEDDDLFGDSSEPSKPKPSMSISSPQPKILKRKAAPQLFMSPKKRPNLGPS